MVLTLPAPETMAEVAAEDVVDVDEIVVVDADGELETIALVVAESTPVLELKNSINNKLE